MIRGGMGEGGTERKGRERREWKGGKGKA